MYIRYFNRTSPFSPIIERNTNVLSLAAAGLIGAGISAIGGLASSAMSNSSTSSLNKANRDWQEKMWNKTNEYNTPANQVARLRAAGLNPQLVALDGSSAGSVGTPSSFAPDYSGIQQGAVSAAEMISSLPIQEKQSELLSSQAQKNNTENAFDLASFATRLGQLEETLRKTNGETKGIEMANNLLSETFDLQKKRFDLENQSLQTQILLNKANTKCVETENLLKEYNLTTILPAQYRQIVAQTALTAAQEKWTYKQIDYQAQQIAIMLYSAQTDRMNAITNQQNAVTNQYNAVTNRMVGESQVAQNYANTSATYQNIDMNSEEFKRLRASVRSDITDLQFNTDWNNSGFGSFMNTIGRTIKTISPITGSASSVGSLFK